MKTSSYDRAAALILALLLLIGALVAVLLGLWLSSIVLRPPRAVPVNLVPRGDGAGDDTDQYDADVLMPGMEIEREEPTFLESLESVVNVVADNATTFSDASPTDDSLLTPGGKLGDGRTRGDGTGLAGRVRRWEFEFNKGITVAEYAEMLDFFGIELGVLQSGGKVVYASRLASVKPTVREGASGEEKRYYLTWLKGVTNDSDRELLEKAGIRAEGRLIIKFIPPTLETELETLERDYAKDRLRDVKASFFRVVKEGDRYRFHLYYQVY